MTDTLAVRKRALANFGPNKLLVFDKAMIEFYQQVTAEGTRGEEF